MKKILLKIFGLFLIAMAAPSLYGMSEDEFEKTIQEKQEQQQLQDFDFDDAIENASQTGYFGGLSDPDILDLVENLNLLIKYNKNEKLINTLNKIQKTLFPIRSSQNIRWYFINNHKQRFNDLEGFWTNLKNNLNKFDLDTVKAFKKPIEIIKNNMPSNDSTTHTESNNLLDAIEKGLKEKIQNNKQAKLDSKEQKKEVALNKGAEEEKILEEYYKKLEKFPSININRNFLGFTVVELLWIEYKRKSDTDLLQQTKENEEKINQNIDPNEKKRLEQLALSDKKILAGNYKIHLMPKLDEIRKTVGLLASSLKKEEFYNLIDVFKVKSNLQFLTDENNLIVPLIVIYPKTGKDKAQKALDKIIELFKDQQGLDQTPRYNQKVTSLIYFAQGNADDKAIPGLQNYFEQPDMIYYKPDFTGTEEDYHLKF